ncbi:MAG TPA: hypothetical protein EYP51_02180 [Thiotrichales bacterium]|nr:hypothetical protein [Thiotrichales bacterium]
MFLAIVQKHHARWWFFPFIHWYGIIAIIPHFRFLRFSSSTRLASSSCLRFSSTMRSFSSSNFRFSSARRFASSSASSFSLAMRNSSSLRFSSVC